MKNQNNHLNWWNVQINKNQETVLHEYSEFISPNYDWYAADMRKDLPTLLRDGLIFGIDSIALGKGRQEIVATTIYFADGLGVPLTAVIQEIQRRKIFFQNPNQMQ